MCSPESRQGSPDGRKDSPGLEALAQLGSPASSRPQTVGGRSQASALAQLADVEGSSWGPRGSHAPSKYGSFSADLDFDEFLDRQQRFLAVCTSHKICCLTIEAVAAVVVTAAALVSACGHHCYMCHTCRQPSACYIINNQTAACILMMYIVQPKCVHCNVQDGTNYDIRNCIRVYTKLTASCVAFNSPELHCTSHTSCITQSAR